MKSMTQNFQIKKIILKAIVEFHMRLKSSKNQIPFDEKEKCMLASIMALLVNEVKLAVEFLKYCENLKEVKYHYIIISQIVGELEVGKKISGNPEVQTAFF